jgi:hypothetical protein
VYYVVLLLDVSSTAESSTRAIEMETFVCSLSNEHLVSVTFLIFIALVWLLEREVGMVGLLAEGCDSQI